MRDALHVLALWTHILGIALFVGPQFFLAFAWVPASRGIADLPTRLQAMRTITRRFGYIGGVGLLLILVAGVYLVATWRSYYHQPSDLGFWELHYGVVFTAKMAVLAVMLGMLALHTFVVGPRLLDRMEAQARGEEVPETVLGRVRAQSMALSIGGLVLTLVIMVMGASLTTYTFSLREW
jgi:putative copper resistance protein D